MNRPMLKLVLSLLLLVSGGLVDFARAEGPTNPTPPGQDRGTRDEGGGGGGPGGPGGGGRRRFGPGGGGFEFTEEEAQAAEAFMKQHSPRRWAKLEQLPDQQRRGLRRLVINRYRMLERVKEDDPDLYDLRVREIELEDDAFGLGRDIREAAPDQRDALTKTLKDKVTEWMDISLQQRQRRIERLEKALEVAKTKLADDKQNLQKKIDETLDKLITDPNADLQRLHDPGMDRPDRDRDGPPQDGKPPEDQKPDGPPPEKP